MTPHRLILAFLYFFVVLVVLPIFCSDKIYSLHYQDDPKRNAEIDAVKREYRRNGVKEYLYHIQDNESLAFHKSKLSAPVYNLVIAMAHNSTPKEDLVLSQVVTEIDRNIRREQGYHSALIICNTTSAPDSELENLAQFYPVMSTDTTTIKGKKALDSEELLRRSFIGCIRQGLERTNNAQHVTVIRDLVVPYPGFLTVVNQVMNRRLSNKFVRGELMPSETPWLFLHLHEPVPFRHYDLSGSSFGEISMVTLSGAVIFCLVFRWLEGPQQTFVTQVTYAFYGALLFLTFALVLGRPYVSELRRVVVDFYRLYDPYEPVHFSAMSFPTRTLPELLDQMNSHRCSPYVPFHRAMNQMIATLDLPGYVISPSLVRYVSRT